MTQHSEQRAQDRRANGALAGLIATLMFISIIVGKAPEADRTEATSAIGMPHPSLLVAASYDP